MTEITEKICIKCLIQKPLSAFYFSKNNLTGHASTCLECVDMAYQKNKIILEKEKVDAQIARSTKRKELFIKERKVEQERKIRQYTEALLEPSRCQGHVYLLVCSNGLYKIGKSKNVYKRIDSLNREIPIEIKYVHSILSDIYSQAEKYLHNKFSNEWKGREWFCLSQEQVDWICSLGDFEIDKFISGTMHMPVMTN
jgi:hypothetical protein